VGPGLLPADVQGRRRRGAQGRLSAIHLGHYVRLLHTAQENLAQGFRTVAEGHAEEADIFHLCHKLAAQCESHAERLGPHRERYDDPSSDEPDALHSDIFRGPRSGGLGLLRDLQDLYVMAAEVDIVWTLVGQAARGARDEALLAVVSDCEQETAIQLKWLRTRLKQVAPQALVVA
jgi:hypothetical protein